MKPSKIGVISFVALATVMVLTYNACSVRRQMAQLPTNLSSTDPNSNGQNNNNNPPVHSSSEVMISSGTLKLTAVGKMLTPNLNGRIMMVRSPATSKTEVYVHVSGLSASTKYEAHVHNQPCSLGGGAHYKIDNKISAVVESNEVWPIVTTGADGSGLGFASTNHLVRPEGQSIVIHAADNARLACGDLGPQASVTYKSGRFISLPAGVAAGRLIKGAAVITRNAPANQTIVSAQVTGLAPNTSYTAHVHNLPCATGEGGAHYKNNAAVTEAVPSPANEIWLTFAANANGSAFARVESDHVARPDAVSIVIHDPVTPANRLACVDLNIDGGFLSTEVGFQKNYNVIGMGGIERFPNGTTQAFISVSGLLPNGAYVPHVHDRPCHINGGGGHYKIDSSNPAAVEANEIWPKANSDASGVAVGSALVQHLARPEAQSIVIHDPADGARVACMDVY